MPNRPAPIPTSVPVITKSQHPQPSRPSESAPSIAQEPLHWDHQGRADQKAYIERILKAATPLGPLTFEPPRRWIDADGNAWADRGCGLRVIDVQHNGEVVDGRAGRAKQADGEWHLFTIEEPAIIRLPRLQRIAAAMAEQHSRHAAELEHAMANISLRPAGTWITGKPAPPHHVDIMLSEAVHTLETAGGRIEDNGTILSPYIQPDSTGVLDELRPGPLYGAVQLIASIPQATRVALVKAAKAGKGWPDKYVDHQGELYTWKPKR
jgi:hypothetical protein